MKLMLKVIPGAKKNELKQAEGLCKIYLTAPPVDGKANEALIKFLAEYYQVKQSAIEILKGLKSRHKIVNILGI